MRKYIDALLDYAIEKKLIEPEDRTWAFNRLLEALGLDAAEEGSGEALRLPLEEILSALTEDAVARGIVRDSGAARDLFDTKLMGLLTPAPHEVRAKFAALYARSPEAATDWYYRFSEDTNYIRRDRIKRDLRWVCDSAYGPVDISINLSKPEKDPRDIAAARLAPQGGYPACQLCASNEGYAGRIDHPARQNLRLIPLSINGDPWFWQYSPYVYYNEHCIVLNSRHTPMKIDRSTFEKLFDFISLYPHYFLGSNADLPIVGGSILSHDHFQGGRYEFAMAKAPVERELVFKGFEEVRAGTVRWPMSVLRLTGPDRGRLTDLAEKILRVWRGYSDETAGIYAFTGGTPHNTITPIARRRGEDFQLDLVLRNNRTTEEFPLGLFHPHPELHHIKKENIGLIEVMGLAVLPSRLKTELDAVEQALLAGADLRADKRTAAHADWAEELMARRQPAPEELGEVLRQEVGAVFIRVLEDAGVYKRTPEGQEAFMRFVEAVNGTE